MFGPPSNKPIVTIPMSDIIRMGETGTRHLARTTTGSTGMSPGSKRSKKPDTFSAGLKLPKLPVAKDKFRSKKPSEKLPDTPFLPPIETSKKKTRVRGNNWRGDSPSSSDDEVDETMKKVKGFLEQRQNVMSRTKLDSEIHSRISKAVTSMQVLEKGIKTLDDTLILAKGRAVAAASGRKPTGKVIEDIVPRPIETPEKLAKKPLKHVDVTRQVKSMFGLDQMKVVAGSDGEDDSAEEVDSDADYLGAMTQGEPGSIHGNATPITDPTLRKIAHLNDKSFMNRHHKRELRLSKELNGMKNQLEALNSRSEREAQRNKLKLKKVKVNMERPMNLTRLMAYDPTKGPPKELTDFLQTSGGSTGGWDHEDHSIFMQSYMKWKHRPSHIVDFVSKQCPGRSLEDVANHLTWFEKYDTLNKANKAYIRQWQISKRRERETMYQMAEQNQRAKIEGNKSRQEMIRAKREEEKEREHLRLENWKKAQLEAKKRNELTIGGTRIKADITNATAKLSEGMKASKTRLLNLIAPENKLHKILAKPTSSLNLKSKPAIEKSPKEEAKESKGDLSPPDSHTSSGIFSDQEVDSEYEAELRLGIGDMSITNYDYTFGSDSEAEEEKVLEAEFGGGDSVQTKIHTIQGKASKVPSLPMEIFKSRRGSNKKVIAGYQEKDAAMIKAKRQAILDKNERQRNKTYLSSNEVKERIGKIEIPSQVLKPTKGWKMRDNVRDLEVLQHVGREARRNDKDLYHNEPRVPSPKMFQSAPNIKQIPKLGATGWRQY